MTTPKIPSRKYAALQSYKRPEPPDRRIPGNGDGAFAGSRLVRQETDVSQAQNENNEDDWIKYMHRASASIALRNALRVGGFSLWNCAPGKIAIYTDSGEGGVFDEAAFAAHVARFYDEHF